MKNTHIQGGGIACVCARMCDDDGREGVLKLLLYKK
jgi:hypothetical protein